MKIYRIQLLFLTLLFVGLQVMQSTDYEHLNSLFRQPLNQKVFSTANVPLRSGSTSAQSNDLHEIRIIFRVEKSIAKSDVLKKILSLLQSILQNIKTEAELNTFYNNLKLLYQGMHKTVKSVNLLEETPEEEEDTNDQDKIDINLKVQYSIVKLNLWNDIKLILQSILENINTEEELNIFYNNLKKLNFSLKELFAKQTRKAWEATKKLGSKVKDRVVARYKYIKENPANIFSAGLIVAGLGLHVYNQKKIMQTVRAQKKEYWRNVYNVYKEKYAMKELLMNLENMKTRLRM